MSVNEQHSGVLVRQECLERTGLSVTAGAEILGVSRQALSNVLTGKSGFLQRWPSGLTWCLVAVPKRGSSAN